MFAVKALCILACAALAFADGGEVERIVNGHNARVGQFAFMASLRNVNNKHFCGGAIIGNRWILSAGRCIQASTTAANTFVFVGAHTLRDGVRHALDKIIKHPENTARNFPHDVSVLRTRGLIQFNARVRQITLPTADLLKNTANIPAFVAGWGNTRKPNIGTPTVLQWKETRTISINECQHRMGDRRGRVIHGRLICTRSGDGMGICTGDNGGPLFTRENVLVGVVSFSIQCGTGRPDVYTPVFPHLKFIRLALQAR